MINSYIILNRKTSFIIHFFIFNTLLIFIFVIWGLNTFYYQNFIQIHSKILYFDSDYLMEALVPVKEVNQITKSSQLLIDSKKYNYIIYKIDQNATYINNDNYQKVYLKISNLDKEYLINGYETKVKIITEKKKIISYLKDKKEE